MVNYTQLGNSGLIVSDLCLGTTYFGTDIDAAESLRIMNVAFENGVNFIDCANAYGFGKAEETVGRFIATARHRKVVTSKVHIPMSDEPNQYGSGRKHILDSIDKSLMRLNTDFVDIYMLHYYDYDTPLDESLMAMEDIVRAGKARYIGLSNFSGSQLVKALWLNDKHNRHELITAQTLYNAFSRESEHELFPACEQFGVGVMAYSPQAGGFLLGKHRKFKAAAGSHMVETHADSRFHRNAYWSEHYFTAIEKLITLADKHKVSLNALALRWAITARAVNACVVGVRDVKQLNSCLEAWNAKIPVQALSDYSAISDALLGSTPWRGIRDWKSANA